jgi:flagellin-like protein
LTNKKGISPLIATVLIIGFTIVIAVLVITWINNLVTDETDNVACESDALSKCINNVVSYSAAHTTGTTNVKLTIDNSGADSVTIQSVFLAGGSIVETTGAQLTTIVPAYTIQDVVWQETTAGNAGLVDQVKAIIEVTGTHGSLECTESCGEGELVEVVKT